MVKCEVLMLVQSCTQKKIPTDIELSLYTLPFLFRPFLRLREIVYSPLFIVLVTVDSIDACILSAAAPSLSPILSLTEALLL